jgi:hypothetical protein
LALKFEKILNQIQNVLCLKTMAVLSFITKKWSIRLELVSHQTKIVLEKSDQILLLQSCLQNLQNDCLKLFKKTSFADFIHYLEWYSGVILHVLAEIEHAETGKIFDQHRLNYVQSKGWLHGEKNTSFFGANSQVVNEETVRLSIMSVEGLKSVILDTLSAMHDDCHKNDETPEELSAGLMTQVFLLEKSMQKARDDLHQARRKVSMIIYNCSFWDTVFCSCPTENFRCRVNISKGILEELNLNRNYLEGKLWYSRDNINEHLLLGKIPDRLSGYEITRDLLCQIAGEEELVFAKFRKRTLDKISSEEMRLADQRTRIDRNYLCYLHDDEIDD